MSADTNVHGAGVSVIRDPNGVYAGSPVYTNTDPGKTAPPIANGNIAWQ
jgi:hypothetical protein